MGPEAARETERGRPDALRWGVAVATSLALAVVLTWPWAIELWRGRIAGDAGQFTWNAWWVAHQVLSLHNPWWTDFQYAPVGAYLTGHTLDTLLFALAAPLTAVIGPIPVYGLVIIVLHAAAAVLMWRLGLAMGLGAVGAATVGILWASSPIVVYKATAHVHQLVLVAALPAAFLLWRRLARTERVRDGVVLGAFVGAGLLTDLLVAAYLLLALGAAEAYLLLLGSSRTRLRRRAPALLAGTATLLLVGLPLWLVTIRAESTGHYAATQGDRVESARSFNADVVQFVLPSPFSRFLDGVYRHAADRLGGLSEFNVDTPVSLGYATLALALVGLLATRRIRRTRWLAASVVVCALLSLGPTLKLAGHVYRPVPVERGADLSAVLPGTWLTAVPVLRDLRIPPRFMLLGAFAVVLLAGLGARAAVRQGRVGVVAVVCLCAVAVAEGAVAMEGDADPDAKRIARLIADDPRGGIVVDVPLAWADGFSSLGYAPVVGRPLFQQALHEKPIASGYISRIDRSRYDLLLEHPLYRALLLRQVSPEAAPDLPSPSEAAVRADAERLEARWVVVWPEADRRVLPFLRRLGYRQIAVSTGGIHLYTRG